MSKSLNVILRIKLHSYTTQQFNSMRKKILLAAIELYHNQEISQTPYRGLIAKILARLGKPRQFSGSSIKAGAKVSSRPAPSSFFPTSEMKRMRIKYEEVYIPAGEFRVRCARHPTPALLRNLTRPSKVWTVREMELHALYRSRVLYSYVYMYSF